MKKDKKRLIIMTTVGIIMLIAAIFFTYQMLRKDDVTSSNLLVLLVPILLVVFMAFLINRRYQDVKKGLPLEDERSKSVMNRTAAMSFYTTLYWLLAISFFEDFFAGFLFKSEHLSASNTVSLGILGMAIFFGSYWFYFNRK
ncbi:hypothetical protein ACFL21_05095 [Patescibacteria group bacterium]